MPDKKIFLTLPYRNRQPLVRYIRGERYQDRHRRRHEAAMLHVDTVAAWCAYRGVESMEVVNKNHSYYTVWTFRCPNKLAVWHPHAGKLTMKPVLMDRHVFSVKVHDWEQLLVVLEWWLETNAV